MNAKKITNKDRKFRQSTYAYSYADAAARTGARGFTDVDVGKRAIQVDTGVRYLLTSHSSGVPTWEAAPDIDDLASTAVGLGDSLVGHYDAGSRWTATTVWGILEELMDRIVATGATSLSKILGIEDSGGKITATTVDGALVENRTALDVVEALFEAQVDTLYVGKHGNDSSSGKSVESAKLTFGSAITAASALTPAADNQIAIVCQDSGIYAEDITVPSYVHVVAVEATVNGSCTLGTISSIDLGTLTGAVGPCLVVTAGTARAHLRELIVAGAVQGVNITNAVVSLLVDRATVEDGDLFVVNNAAGVLDLQCGYVDITGTGSAVVATDGTINASLGNVGCAGAGTGFEAAAAATAIIHAVVVALACSVRWNLGAASELHLTATQMAAGTMTGDITGLTEPGLRDDVIYVGKHGLDTNEGKTPETAMLTIGAAITAASGLGPGAANEIAVVVTDSGIYAENLTVPSYVHLVAPMAQISDGAGGLALATLASVDIGILTASAGGCMAVAAGTAIARIKLLRIAGAITGVLCNGGFLDLTVDRCECENGDPFVVNGNPATAGMNLVCNSINITGTASALNSQSGPLNAVVGRIDDAGAGTAFETAASANAIIHAQVGDIDCNTRWTLGAASELHLSCAHMTAGVETGTVTRLSIAGEVFESGGPTNLAVGAVADTQYLRRTGTTVVGGNAQEARGVPMVNRIQMLGAPGAMPGGDTIVIGADTYEFNTNTPPDVAGGGTGGFIWVYQGANSAASRANFINAVNGVIDAPNITYDGPVTETMVAEAGVSLGDVIVQSADAIGGNPAPSAVATVTTETLTTVTDIWDQGTMLSGIAAGVQQQAVSLTTITAAMIVKGDVQMEFDFTPTRHILQNRNRLQNEAHVIVGDGVSLTLAGGGAPNNQPGDIVDCWVWS